MQHEPSVLDYVKDRLAFWRPTRLRLDDPIPADQAAAPDRVPAPDEAAPVAEVPAERPVAPRDSAGWRRALPWGALGGLLAALIAQLALEPPTRGALFGAVGYTAAAFLLGYAAWNGPLTPAPLRPDSARDTGWKVRADWAFVTLPVLLVAFYLFGGGVFTPVNLLLWLGGLFAFLVAFWPQAAGGPGLAARVRSFTKHALFSGWWWNVSPFALAFALAALVVAFFRFHRLAEVPLEMVSDHAEKLLDVWDVLNGRLNIFFPRNTGREPLQFYWSALVTQVFPTGVSFMALKVGTAIASLLTSLYTYFLGREIANRWVGLLAGLMVGIAYWTNMFTRIALRFAFYPAFVAPTLFYLVRGLRTRSRGDAILAGIFLGIGLNGYSSTRILPFLVVITVGLYVLHAQSRGARKLALAHLVLLAAAALVIFLPLLRFWMENPDLFAYRAFTRLGDWERPLPGPAGVIFLQNLWRAVIMPFWDDGETWVHSITHRPALDVTSAALYFAGLVLVVARYLRRRHWVDLFLLVSVPVLMMPSILSLAFPNENPSLNRPAGAVVPVFLIAAIGLEALLRAVRQGLGGRRGAVASLALAVALLALSAGQNYHLVFNVYDQQYRQSTWNSSEMGRVLRGFAESVGARDSGYVVAYPYWVDTRLVGINAGYPDKDYAIQPDQIAATSADPRTKLFIVNPQDTAALQILQQTYPEGLLNAYRSATPGKDFLTFLVPSRVSP